MRKANNKKGFVLIELVVVLLIIVSLVLLLIPLVIHYIDDAKTKAEISETRMIYVGLQTVRATNSTDNHEDLFSYKLKNNRILNSKGRKYLKDLTGGKIGQVEKIRFNSGGGVKSFEYYTTNGSTVKYSNNEYEVVELY